MTNKIETGHLGVTWDSDFKYLPYVRQPVTSYEVEVWKNMGYDFVKNYTGLMYDNSNIMPKWISSLDNAFGLYNQTYTFYKMETLDIMPVHTDHYRTYMKLYGVEYDQVYRVLVMLEDWKPGHYLEVDGMAFTSWKAGDWFKWKSDTPHAAANIGIEPRYTLQITGVSVYSGQLNKLFCVSVPDKNDTFENSHPFFQHVILNKVPDIHIKPFMVYMNNRKIIDLDQLTHTQQGVDFINKEGLKIYLWEPLCSYIEANSGLKNSFYEEFKHDIDYNLLRTDELNSILSYAQKNNINNITVHTCDYDVEKYYPYYVQQGLKLITDDLFLKTQDALKIKDSDLHSDFTTKFMCLNWRHTKHRELLATFLVNKSVKLSWYFKSSFDSLKQDLFFDLDSWQHKHVEFYNTLKQNNSFIRDNGPFIVDIYSNTTVEVSPSQTNNSYPECDIYEPGTTPALFNHKLTLLQHYNDIFVDVINETRFAQPTGNFSEKVFQAMQYKKPFILVAPPFTLQYVKSFGFKTFDNFWDESYDTIMDHEVRLSMIFKLIDDLDKKSISELKEMYINMGEVLNHNLKIFRENFANPNYTTGIKS